MTYQQVIIAEKPDLGRAVIEGLESKIGVKAEKKNGYAVVGDVAVTWAFGHLLKLSDPEDYDSKYKVWSFDNLPMSFYHDVRYKVDPDKAHQVKIISNLCKEAKEIVNCGDPDAEGQRLIDELLEHFGINNKPVLRLLINDNNIKGVVKALEQMESNKKFYGLSQSALARALADQLYGYNLTRGYSLASQQEGHKGVKSVGRVQTPILGLIVARDLAHESHQKSYFYTMNGIFKTSAGDINMRFLAPEDFPRDDKKRLVNDDGLKRVKVACESQKGSIKSVETKDKTEAPPLPYNLLLLQADANRIFGFTADSVLKITQDLREKHRLITYNRSDSQYLKDETFEDAPEILSAIESTAPHLAQAAQSGNTSIKSKAFNSAKVTAHSAIVPTGAKIQWDKLNDKEQKIYELIARRYILQFYQGRKYQETGIIVDCQGYLFGVTGRVTTETGWAAVFEPEKKTKDTEDDSDDLVSSEDLSRLSVGGEAVCKNCKIEQKATSPPPYFTEETLLKALTHIADYAENPNTKKLLKEKDKGKDGEHGGIGTPATRSSIIEGLKKREFIENKGKNIISTALGRAFIEALPKTATSVDMTALWHQEQQEIEEGRKMVAEFLDGVFEFVSHEIKNIKSQGFKMAQVGTKCPKCQTGILQSRKNKATGEIFFSCNKYPDCKAAFPADNKGDLVMVLCPKCKTGYLRVINGQNGKFYSCGNYPECKTSFPMKKDGKPELKPPKKK